MANPSQGQASDPRESEPLLESNGSVSSRNDERAMEESEDVPNEHLRTSRLAFTIAPALLFGCFNTAFDLSFLMTNYIRIASDLNSLKDAVWIVLTGSISFAAFQPLYGHFSNLYGREHAILFAFSTYGLGVLLCGFSVRLWQLSFSRIIVNLGSSGTSLLTTVIINDLVYLTDIALWQSAVTCVETVALMAGGPLGSTVSKALNWHWVFLFEVISIAVATVFLYFSFRLVGNHPNGTGALGLPAATHPTFSQLDVTGGIFLITCIAAPFFTLTFGDNVMPWNHPVEITLLVAAPLLIGAFIYFEATFPERPIVPVKHLKDLPVVKVLVCVFGVVFSFNAILFNLPLYIEIRAFDGSAFHDWALTCVYLGQPAGAVFGGWVIRKSRQVKDLMIINAAFTELLYILYATGAMKPELVGYSPFLVALGFCTGVWQSCLLVALLAVVERKYQPQMIAIYDLTLTLGGDLVIAISSSMTRSLFKTKTRDQLGESPDTEKIIREALQNLGNLRDYSLEIQETVLKCFESAVRSTFVLPCVMMGLVMLVVASMERVESALGIHTPACRGEDD